MVKSIQITLDKKDPRYYTDFVYRHSMDIVEQITPVYDEFDNIRNGRRYTLNDIKKETVKQYSFYYRSSTDGSLIIEDNFGWLRPVLAQEISNLLNRRGRNTVIVTDMGGSGISGVHSVILVGRSKDSEMK